MAAVCQELSLIVGCMHRGLFGMLDVVADDDKDLLAALVGEDMLMVVEEN